MRSKLGFLFIAITLLFTGCEYDYGVGLEYERQVVINSIITPDSTIKAKIFWTREIGSSEEFNLVEDFSAKIYENDKLVFEGSNLRDSIKTAYYPIEGARYRIEVEVPEYSGIVSAETSIPFVPTAEIKHSIIDSTSSTYRRYFEINKISSKTKVRSIVLRTLGLYENHEPVLSGYLYTNNAFCDQFNVYIDQFSGNGTFHEEFIRIPYKSIDLATPISFSVEDASPIYSDGTIIGYDDWGFPLYDNTIYNIIGVALEVIAPSDDYDKYYKAAYQHWNMGDTGVPIFNVNVRVHSNVENGLGIFAGYSCISYKMEVEHDEE